MVRTWEPGIDTEGITALRTAMLVVPWLQTPRKLHSRTVITYTKPVSSNSFSIAAGGLKWYLAFRNCDTRVALGALLTTLKETFCQSLPAAPVDPVRSSSSESHAPADTNKRNFSIAATL